MKSQKIWYYEVYRKTDNQGIRHYTPVLATNIEEAKHKQNFRMATYNDVIDHFCGTGEIFKGIIEVAEGFFLWEEYPDSDCDYRQLHTLQVAVLATEREI
jgi:hypothetical protein